MQRGTDPTPFDPRDGRKSGVRFSSVESATEIAAEQLRVSHIRTVVVESARELATAEAAHTRALASLAEEAYANVATLRDVPMRIRSYAAECAIPLGVSDRVLERNIEDAYQLVHDFPRTFEALENGALSMRHARVITAEAEPLPIDAWPEYEQHLLEVAAGKPLGRLRETARGIAEALQPETIDRRYEQAMARRCVCVRDMPDGVAEIGAVLPKVLAYAIYDRITQVARGVKEHTESGLQSEDDSPDASHGESDEGHSQHDCAPPDRELSTYRTDVFAELLLVGLPATKGDRGEGAESDGGNELGGCFGDAGLSRGISGSATNTARVAAGITPSVSITIPIGSHATPASVDGNGPIDNVTARRLAAVAPGWDRAVLDDSNCVVSVDRYTVPESVKRVLRIRDKRCRFPGCVMPGIVCDIDHTVEWMNGGKTEVSNLGNLCRRHHSMKHPSLPESVRWHVKQDAGGVFVWTSPSGEQYVDYPEHRYAESKAPSDTGNAAAAESGLAAASEPGPEGAPETQPAAEPAAEYPTEPF